MIDAKLSAAILDNFNRDAIETHVGTAFHESADFKATPIPLPVVATVYEHYKGNIYLVVGYNNLESTNPKHPPMVEYVGENGNKWSKPLTEWYEKMKPANDRKFRFHDGCKPIMVVHRELELTCVSFIDQTHRTSA